MVYDDISIATRALQSFYSDLVDRYPPMNGPGAPSVEHIDAHPEMEPFLTSYTISDQIIYAEFAWSVADSATDLFAGLAERHGVAVAYVSDEPLRISRPGRRRRGWPFPRRVR